MQFRSEPVLEHGETPLPDDGQLEALLSRNTPVEGRDSRAYVCSVGAWRDPVQRDAQLAEILGLVEAAGYALVGHECVKLNRSTPRTHLGSGTAREVAARAREVGATLLVIDAPLSPSQTRNLEDVTSLSIADREAVILSVFLKHARSRSARIQVQIAQLEYLRPRIRGLGLDMDQQAGAGNYGRGAGETASELLARQLDDRLVRLRRAFAKIERAGGERRKRRDGTLRIALVGYTNAGKTSLMNALSGSELATRARPFETLDTTTRCLTRHGGEVLLADTVGFIRDLPERLRTSFSTTLAEAREADLLVLVVDGSDPEWPMHLETTREQLDAIGANARRVVVLNKRDRMAAVPDDIGAHMGGAPWWAVSAFDPEGVARLREALLEAVRAEGARVMELTVPYAATAVSSAIYRWCRVLRSDPVPDGLRIAFEGSPAAIGRVLARAEEAGCL